MRNTLLLVGAIALTILSWGLWGSMLQWGQAGMSTAPPQLARLRPFVCVGLAYFLIGVIVPALWLHFHGEKGDWTVTGVIWSLAGGALGAVGALGLILAFTFGGKPIYVMPLVFGGAPVVNAFLTIYLAGQIKEIGPVFLAGLFMVILGAVTVLLCAPHAPPPAATAAAAAAVAEAAPANDAPTAETNTAPIPSAVATPTTGFWSWVLRLSALALGIASWGSYGPVLHKGQAAMHHSRMRPLLCVGIAYFVIAVVTPYFFLGEMGEASRYFGWSHFFHGTIWSLAGGMFGALGALGIILAFNFGGKPVFVMPLVFGGAPVVNTLFAVTTTGQLGNVGALFFAGLILVITGSAMVLVLAPRGEAPVSVNRPAGAGEP